MKTTTPIQLNEENFESEVRQSSIPVLVDFWAEWCPPCRVLGPTIDAIAKEYEGRAKIGKVNIDSNQQLATQYAIQSIPTTLLFVEGQVVERFVGVVPKGELERAIDRPLQNVA